MSPDDAELNIRFPRPHEYPAAWLMFVQFWVTIGIISAPHYHRSAPASSWGHALSLGLADAAIWSGVCLAGYWFAWRIPVRGRSPVAAAIWVAAATAFLLGVRDLAVSVALASPARPAGSLTTHVLIVATFITEGFAVRYFFQYRRRELMASRLETRLTRANLRVLQVRLRPAFVFSAIDTIAGLMHQDTRLADRMLTRLGDVLRAALRSSRTNLVPLRDELQAVELYRHIEEARSAASFEFVVQADAAAEGVLVPNLLLQPLIEHAAREAAAVTTAGPARVEIRARLDASHLRIEIHPAGGHAPGGPALSAEREMDELKARLEQFYGGRYELRHTRDDAGRTLLRVAIPAERTGLGGDRLAGRRHAPPDR